MGSIPDQVIDIQSLQEELEVMRLNLATAQERLRREEDKNEELQAAADYERRLFALDNQIISGAQKVIMVAVRAYILTLWHPGNALGQYVRVPMWDIARSTGLSTDTVGSSIKRLHAVGLLDRQERPDRETKEGPPHTLIYVALTLLSYNPESIVLPPGKKRGHGGERQRCKFDDCRSENLVRRVVVVCNDCGRQQGPAEEIPVNAPDPLDDLPETQAPGRQNVQESERSDVQVPGGLDVQEPGTPAPEVVRQVAEVETEKRQVVKVVKPLTPKPVATCALCERDCQKVVRSWIWREDEKEWCCISCYSPLSWSERERQREQEKEKEGDIWKTPF